MRVSGATLSWKRTRAATDATRGVRMFFLELAKERPLSVRTTPASITSMDHIVVSTADPEHAAALYGARLGLDMALDRSHPDWGRLMFFRCGDLIVEVTHRPGKHPDAARDTLWGMTWRVADMDATRATAGRRWRRRLGNPNRPQAGHAGDDGAQPHLQNPDPAAGADAEAVMPLPDRVSG